MQTELSSVRKGKLTQDLMIVKNPVFSTWGVFASSVTLESQSHRHYSYLERNDGLCYFFHL